MSYIITEVDLASSIHTRRWRINVATYNKSISFDCFFFGKNRRNRSKKFLYHCCQEVDYEISKSLLGEKVEDITDIDLWDFYKVIGYDRKSKKYGQNN